MTPQLVKVGETVIAIGGLFPEEALSVDDAGRLATILHHAVLAARTEHPERNTNGNNPLDRGVDPRERERCGHWFHPNSSPNMTLC